MQNSVAELMAAAVVEILEEVDVDHENGDAVMNLRKTINSSSLARLLSKLVRLHSFL